MTESNNEVDLFKLFAETIYFLKKSKKIILSFFCIGIIAGLTYFIIYSPPSRFYYRKTFTVQSNQIPNDMMMEIINSIGLKLKHISNSLNSETLAGDLGLSISVVNELKMITAEIKPSNLIEIKIEAYDKQAVDSVIKGVEHYVIMNEYVKSREILIRSQRLKLLEVVDNLMEEAINKKNLNKDYYESNASLIKLLTNGKSGHWSYIELFEQKQKIERDLAFSKELDFVITSNPYEVFDYYTEVLKKVISFGFLGFIFGIVVSLFFNFYEKTKKTIL